MNTRTESGAGPQFDAHVQDASASALALYEAARTCEYAGRVPEAVAGYEQAIALAEERNEDVVLARALQRLGFLRFRTHDVATGMALIERALAVAEGTGDATVIAETLNALGATRIESGEMEQARGFFTRGIALDPASPEIRGFLEQNLGTVANIEGDIDVAKSHYELSLASFLTAGHQRGCAIAYHNLGMNTADRAMWEEADTHFRASLDIATQMNDVALRGHVLLNHTEVHLARGRYEDARRDAEEALRIFDQLGAVDRKAAAYKFLGVLYRELGRPELAEARLKTALELASAVHSVTNEAEASREMAVLYQQMGRNQDALRLLNGAHRLFGKLNAKRDLVEVSGRVSKLVDTYTSVVRDWGRSIESADSYTFGHSERVAEYGVRVAEALGLDDEALTTVRLGAHLHDLGKVRVPHEILNKPGRLTAGEAAIMSMHPVWGLDMLTNIDFPWDLRPLVRSHHEKIDGSGYPDKLRGDEVPFHAQIICVVDVYDALTTTRSYRAAMTHVEALAEMNKCVRWWRRDVWEAFGDSVGAESANA